MDFVLDTNFLIGFWRHPHDGAERQFLDAHADATLALPWVVRAKFLCGAVVANHDLARVSAFLSNYPVIWPNDAILLNYAQFFAQLRRNNLHVGTNDLWIAAAAANAKRPLLTRNVAELSCIDKLTIIDYAKLYTK